VKDIRKIWWIASYPKSGNTWVRLFLDAYVTGRVDLNSVYGHFAFGDLQLSAYQSVCPWPVSQANKYIWPCLRIPALLQMIASRNGMDLALKTHHANVAVDGMPLIPPRLTKGAIYLVRDPRDVAISWSHHADVSMDKAVEFLGSELGTICNDDIGLGHLLKSWSTHVESWVAENEQVKTTVIRYEDLQADPSDQFRLILDRFGCKKIDEERFAWALQETEFASLRAKEEERGFREKRGGEYFFRQGMRHGWRAMDGNGHHEFDAEEVGCPELIDDFRPIDAGWRQTLTSSQVRQIEKEHGDVMAAFGYELAETTLDELIGETDERCSVSDG
jgi:hypothetical protein